MRSEGAPVSAWNWGVSSFPDRDRSGGFAAMAVFTYEALDRRRARLEGTIAADSPRQARDSLRARGLVVCDLRPRHAERRRWWVPSFGSRNHASRLASTAGELSTLLSVGVPLVESLETLSLQHRGTFKTALLLVKDRVAAGAGLAEAIAEHPDVFDELTVRMVEVGENAGNLEEVLQQLADFKDRALELKDRVIGALLYPTIVFAASLAVTLFLMTVVVPMLLTNLLEAGRQLPWPTRVLKTASDLLVRQGWLLGIVAVLGVFFIAALLRTDRGRRVWHRLLLKAPVIGTMAQKQALSRISMVLATLLRSGIVYLKAAEIAARATKNVVYREALLRSSEEVSAGLDIGPALDRTGAFPPLVVHVFTVGQAAGRLEEMLDRLAKSYDRQVASLSARLASVLEPVLILVLAVFVGFILFATLLPILEAGNVL